MSFSKIAGAFAALSLTLGAASAAQAVTYNLDQNNIGGGVTNYGTVTVTQNGLGLNFVVDLIDNTGFHSGGGHTSFAFDLVGAPAVTYSLINPGSPGVPGGFTAAGPGSFQNSPFGNFEYGLNCACQQGGGGQFNTLSFTIMPTNGITQLILDGGPDGIIGAADIQASGIGGATGAIGFAAVPVPEPATWAMMILGMGMVGAGLRLRRNPLAATA